VVLIMEPQKNLGWSTISKGSSTAAVADPKQIFQIALNANANSIILCHNHTGQAFKASQADSQLTKRIKQSGSILEIQVDLPIMKYSVALLHLYISS